MSKTLWLLVLLACQNVDFGGHQETKTDDDVQADQVAEATTSPGKINRRLMIRSFRALNLTMSSLTGVDSSKVSGEFNKISHMLASDNRIESFSGTTQVGIFRLATSYCNKFKNDKPFGLADVNNIAESKTQVAEQLLSRFWHDDLTMRADRTTAVNELVALADSFISAGKGGQAFVAMCTATLATASVTFH